MVYRPLSICGFAREPLNCAFRFGRKLLREGSMSAHSNSFDSFLQRHDERAWAETLAELLPAIHEVDRNATEIWFAFFPLALLRALQQADDPAQLAQRLLLQGKFYLKDQIDSSHTFLYGHRFWPEVKKAIVEHAASASFDGNASLTEQIRAVATKVAQGLKVEASLAVGIVAVALMTVEQTGLDAFKSTPGAVLLDKRHARKSPAQILQERARDDNQGLLGFLRTTDKRWTVTFDENNQDARFPMMHMQEIASAAPNHPRKDWTDVEPRCTINEGPIPVQCRSASCGTCWVGVLGGAEKLSEVAQREGRVIKQLGYIETDEPKPLIRLSCQARGGGAVSIVIPPWNGVFGKYLRQSQEDESREVESVNS
jgi:ferredoxin